MEQTFGQRAVGLSFNPSGDDKVAKIKRAYADLIDVLDAERGETHDSEVKRMLSVAITEAQTSQMWAVKGVTWR